jgi:DNA-directed RNA polymerase sigma subunit (sigma70/sigma32)
VADAGEHTLEEVADIMVISRERVRQIEWKALRRLKHLSVLRDD